MANGNQEFILLLKEQAESLSVNLRFVWDQYLRWYTLFLTFNVAALTYYGTVLEKTSARPNRMVPLAFVVFNVLGVISTYHLYRFSKRAIRHLKETRDEIWRQVNGQQTRIELMAPVFPKRLARWSAIAAGLALGLLAIIWGVAFKIV